jgi:hypothetical protein
MCISPTNIVSSLFPHRCRLFSGRRHHAITSYCASFPRSQGELTASASSSRNALFHRLPSGAENEVLNPHHRRRPASLDRPTLTIHRYKKVISILTTLSITQLHLYFASSLATTPYAIGSPLVAIILFHWHPTLIVPLSLTEQLIGI